MLAKLLTALAGELLHDLLKGVLEDKTLSHGIGLQERIQILLGGQTSASTLPIVGKARTADADALGVLAGGLIAVAVAVAEVDHVVVAPVALAVLGVGHDPGLTEGELVLVALVLQNGEGAVVQGLDERQRLALPMEPEILVLLLGHEHLVELTCVAVPGGGSTEAPGHQVGGHLPLGPHLQAGIQKDRHGILVEVAVGHVEVEEIQINTEDDKDVEVVIAPPVEAPVEEEEEEVIFVVVESMPEFPGGQQAMMRYIAENIKYPVIAQENGIQGRVICQFVVEKDGKVSDIQVVRSSGEASLDKEAVRVINSMPKWKPGKQRGKPVRVKYTLPVNFRLQ